MKTAPATVKFTTPASKVSSIILRANTTTLSLNQSTEVAATVLDSQVSQSWAAWFPLLHKVLARLLRQL
ncbi:MAG: hypothetical protein R3E08_05885 [Thiotrichaceae bacterium]